jgi:hypothetical protein
MADLADKLHHYTPRSLCGHTRSKKLIDTVQDAPETVILAEDEATLYLQATTTAV